MNGLDRAALLPPDLAEPLEAAIAGGLLAPIGGDVLYFPVASSTNDLALRLAERGCGDGTRPPDAAVAVIPGFRRRARDCMCPSSWPVTSQKTERTRRGSGRDG